MRRQSSTGATCQLLLHVGLGVLGVPVALVGQECQPPATRPTGSLSASADLIRATTDDTKLGATGRFVLWSGRPMCPRNSLRRWRTLATLGADYRAKEASSGATSITRSYRADVAQALMLGGRGFLDGAVQLFHNNSLGVQLQQVYRVSAGLTLGDLEVGVGPAYVDQDFGDAGVASSFGAVSVYETVGLTIPFPRIATTITQFARALLPVGEADARQVTMGANVIVPVTAALGVTWSSWAAPIENAPRGRDQDYVTTSLGVSWEF